MVADRLRAFALSMRICLVYDCLFPYTIGGGERWYRSLGERLAEAGHDVTYVTLRQWPRGERGEVAGVRVVAVGPRMALYGEGGNRRVLPPLVFGVGVLWHLLRHGRRYDVVHTSAFPYFSLLAAAAVRPLGRFRLVVDWLEVWSADYWRDYLGPVGGRIGQAVQALCMRVPQRAFCLSRVHEQRLRDGRVRGEVTRLPGAYVGALEPADPVPADEVVVFAGRHIPDKRAPALVPALARARRDLPRLRGAIFGDGPEREEVLRLRAAHDLEDVLDVPGFVNGDEIERALGHALCMVLPSSREGYGMVVMEAAHHGTPSVVVAGPDNAAVELISEGENGVVARSASPEDLAEAIARVHAAGPELRRSTHAWFRRNALARSLESSLETVTRSYTEVASARR
jgi:glycosyltransferase involved in cell wall biosynthesis